MTAATYTTTKSRKPAAKTVRARAARPAAAPTIQEEPLISSVPAYSRIHERKSGRLPLIAGGIAVVATIALVAGTSRTARDAEPFTPTQTASSPAAIATAPPTALPDSRFIAPAPAPVIRQQARMTPRPAAVTPSANPFDANDAALNASASVPAAPTAPAPIAIPPTQSAPEAEAAPIAQPATEPMSNWGAPIGAQTSLTAV